MSDRITEQSAKRPTPPPLEPRNPLCSICSEETTIIDDSFYCEGCEGYWSLDTAFHNEGEWYDPDAEQCSWVLIPWPNEARDFLRDSRFRCVRQADHDGTRHFHPEYSYGFDEKDPHAHSAETKDSAPSVVTVEPVGGAL